VERLGNGFCGVIIKELCMGDIVEQENWTGWKGESGLGEERNQVQRKNYLRG